MSALTLTPAVEDKLATLLWFMEEVRAGRRQGDWAAVYSYLDDAQVSEWLSRMNKAGRTKNTRFTATALSGR